MSDKITEIFGSNVFSTSVMQERLPKKVFAEVMDVMEHGGNISIATADIVANAMKDWAVEKGATHYTHWFQPLTGITAEKHDAFMTRPEDSKTLLQLTGKQLIMGESDASSFPSGGLRSTHYARGYTAWDMTSPAFVKEMTAGTILCIPTIFVSYHGEALDKKTPLLRSMEAINTQGLRILRLFGNTQAQKVFPSVGPEQEYFLVDREKYLNRRDLIYTGRTLFGAPAPKGQELDDQYFGVIRERVGDFMSDLNQELWKLGIPAVTQHNEVAPAQHEMAPIYTMCNLAVDQNQLTMETMKRVATRHGLVCLLHEKPFAGVNGSGKHNNWSIGTDTGENLLDPGDTPNENLQFLLVLSCIMKAVDVHADLLRQSASCVGNEHRLGGQEAPPAIISIFLGDQLDDVVNQIVSNADSIKLLATGKLDSGVSTVPVLNRDATDRNRTTPFAFTGNKFEFRMVGSSDSIADANTTLNAIVAEALCQAADELEAADDFSTACMQVIHRNMTEHQRIIFNGDGYSEEWVQEAARRGLPNLPSLVDAVPALTTQKAINLFTRFGIYTPQELEARAEIMYETYIKVIKIEANTMIHMAAKHYIPAVIHYTTRLAQSINAVASACPQAELSVQRKLLQEVSRYLADASTALEQLKPLMARVDSIDGVKEMALAYHDAVVPAMDALRYPIDTLELMVDKSIWPVPTYGDLMFEV
ncbi:glutamine synthetase III [Pseudoflavonifractor phocaeensis]|uniref:glutamine synthetase III family protein n=1 Tax=Pseudoflavonifractor phocaeensis TaxID=1870988 RepID=UPI0025A45483|nr:glutamine synthetase III [Pseudoflavonifractor phocaeensis]MDM8239912.1 glutamine synthetase III [Pseudoflavonifractor phocaeensis]